MKLDGKVAVVTGASSGMGRAIALLFSLEGAKVVAFARRKERLDELVKEASEKGGTILPYQGDVSVREDIEGAVDFAVNNFGKIDILVNNAGFTDGNIPIHELTDEHWFKQIGTNLNGVMYGSRKAINYMLEKGTGNIINMASVGGLHGGIAGIGYTATKHAVVGMTKNIGYMYAKKGIRCNAICPGGVRTEIITKGVGFEIQSEFGTERMMLGAATSPGMTEPENIADIALFLASDDSKFINGVALPADGGWTAY